MPSVFGASRLSLVAGASLVGTAIAAACTDGFSVDAPRTDAGVDDATLAQAICPEAPPTKNGPPCTLPEGTTCSFGRCGTLLARCTGGAWKWADNPEPRPPCPAQPPDIEARCPPCWPEDVTCTYGSEDCSAADASPNTAVASCVGDRWTVEIRPCRDGGAPDAGADVQRDADADAD